MISIKSSIAAACLILVLTPTSYGQEHPIGTNIEGLLKLARERNPELASMKYEADAASERVVPAGSLPDPKFRTEWRDITRMGEQSPTLAPNRVGSTRYLLMQDVPWFGKRELKREAAEAASDAAKVRAASTWVDLASKIKIVYAQLYYLDQSERLTQEILDLMVRLEKVAQVRYASGLAAQQDVIRSQVEQTSIRSELIGIEAERRQLQARMNALTGRQADEPLAKPTQIRVLPTQAVVNFSSLEQRAKLNNPLLRVEEAQIKAAEKSRDLAYRNRYPDFTLGASPIQYGNSVREWELMVEINIPLQQNARRSQERESEAMLSASRSRRELVSSQILADLYESIAGFDSERRSLKLTTENLLPQSELTFRSALAGYESGKVDFATLLDAQRQIRQAKLNQVKAGINAQMRLAEIERIVGEEL
jgi:outer membrane protein TolC